MTLPDLLLPTYAQMLRALSAWLEKAGAGREDGGDGLLTARRRRGRSLAAPDRHASCR